VTAYRHILVATDGSRRSAPAIRMAAGLAQALGAKLTGLHVVAPYFSARSGAEYASMAGFRRNVEREATRALGAFNAEARARGVAATATSVLGGEPWQAILRTARARKCDLIVMASHGRGGLSALVLGSETAKVLTHSKIPVMVCR
jgi:nucleotide-binding universal stress UspA family protein